MIILSKINQSLLKRKFSKPLKRFKNIHQGERCFVIGNGPSLRASDLDRLKDEKSFAANKIFKIFDKTVWRPTYYVTQDGNVYSSIFDEILDISNACDCCFMYGNGYRALPKAIRKKDNIYFFNSYTKKNEKGESEFSDDISVGVNNGFTVTFASLQIAVYMGFKEIYLLGCDNSYARNADMNGNDKKEANTSDHFYTEAYFETTSDIEHTPQGAPVDFMDGAYKIAKEYGDKHGIKIYNATRGGALEVFPRVDFDKIWQR